MSQNGLEIRALPDWIEIKPAELEQHYAFIQSQLSVLHAKLSAGLTKSEYARLYSMHSILQKCSEVLTQVRALRGA
jgi:hypothetical protein